LATLPVCLCCGADRQSEYPFLPFCSRCESGRCQECRRLLKSQSAPLRVCMCCGEDRQFKHRALPFCSRCLSGSCGKCRSWVRGRISEVYPEAINLIGRSPGPHMPCGWGCGAKLTNGQMQRHFTNCPRRPTVQQETIRHLPRQPNRGGRPRGPRMPCGWHCGAKLTASEMRRHFAGLYHQETRRAGTAITVQNDSAKFEPSVFSYSPIFRTVRENAHTARRILKAWPSAIRVDPVLKTGIGRGAVPVGGT